MLITVGSGIGGDVNSLVPLPRCVKGAVPTSALRQVPPHLRFAAVGRSVTAGRWISWLHRSRPTRGSGLTLNIPMRNRQAQADQVRAELEYRQAQVRLQQLENQVRIEVRNAQFDVQQSRASVDAAQAAVDFARETLDAEQQKLAAGVCNLTAVSAGSGCLDCGWSLTWCRPRRHTKRRESKWIGRPGLLLDRAGIVMATRKAAK